MGPMSWLSFLRGRRSAASGPPVPVVLYTRHPCPLCDEMKRELATAGRTVPFELREVDVDGSRDLKRRFGTRIPVLEIDGETLFEGRADAEALLLALRRSQRSRRRAGAGGD